MSYSATIMILYLFLFHSEAALYIIYVKYVIVIHVVIFPVYIMKCVTCSLCTCLFSVITAVVYNAGFSSDGFWRCGIKVKFE